MCRRGKAVQRARTRWVFVDALTQARDGRLGHDITHAAVGRGGEVASLGDELPIRNGEVCASDAAREGAAWRDDRLVVEAVAAATGAWPRARRMKRVAGALRARARLTAMTWPRGRRGEAGDDPLMSKAARGRACGCALTRDAVLCGEVEDALAEAGRVGATCEPACVVRRACRDDGVARRARAAAAHQEVLARPDTACAQRIEDGAHRVVVACGCAKGRREHLTGEERLRARCDPAWS